MRHADLTTGGSPAARYEKAVLDGDYDLARRVAIEALDSGLPAVQVLTDVVACSMRHIGELWARAVLTTADEHLATAITERVLADLYRCFFTAPPLSRETALAASIHRETHVLGTRMIADVLEGAGFRVVFLGGDLPISDLLAAIERHQPDVVLLGATSDGATETLRATVRQIRDQAADLPVLAGGPAAQQLPRNSEDPILVPDATHVVAAVEAALKQQ